MKTIHNITISVFSKEDEDSENIKEKLLTLFPFELEKNKIKLKEEHLKGFGESVITKFEVNIEKNSLINQFIEHLIEKISEKQKEIISIRKVSIQL